MPFSPIKYLKFGVIGLIAFGIFVIIQNIWINQDINRNYQEKQTLSAARGFDIGFSLHAPSCKTSGNALDCDRSLFLENFEFIGQNSDVVLVHTTLDWPAFLEQKVSYSSDEIDELSQRISLARKMGLKIYLMIDPLNEARDALDPTLQAVTGATEFTHPNVQDLLKRAVYWAAHKYQPEYLAFGSEINLYQTSKPKDFQQFSTLYQTIYQEIKTKYPDITMFTTFQYEDLQNLQGWRAKSHPAQWSLLYQFFPHVDAIAISTYPSFVFPTDQPLPDNYYLKLKNYAGSKPIIIAESGFASESLPTNTKLPTGFTKSESYFQGSPSGQSAFLEKIKLEAKELDLELFLYLFATDTDWLTGEYQMYQNLGLRKIKKTNRDEELEKQPKPALKVWEKMYRMD